MKPSALSLPTATPAGTCLDYVLEAADLLDSCCRRLSLIGPRDNSLSDLALYLATTERQIHEYVLSILSEAGESARPGVDDLNLMVTCARLSTIRVTLESDIVYSNIGRKTGGVNSLLFYLINTLHLCLQRIEDADKILCGKEAARGRSRSWAVDVDKRHVSGYFRDRGSGRGDFLLQNGTDGAQRLARRQQITNTVFRWVKRVGVSLGVGGIMWYALDKKEGVASKDNQTKIAKTAGKIVAAVFCRSVMVRRYEVWRLRHRLEDSTQSLAMWQQKWIIISSVISNNKLRKTMSYNQLIAQPSAEDHNEESKASSRRLLEALPLRSNKGAFWYSQGAFRLLLVRRVMDLVYASVGTAIDMTGPDGAYGLWVPLAGMFASYYAVAGPDVTSTKAAHMVAAPSMDFIKRAWGMVTIPPIRWLTTEAARLFKGIAIIERVTIGGVGCLVISHAPLPCLSAAIERGRRQQKRRDAALGDIKEDPNAPSHGGRDDLETHEVIFHITGGGWFIHTTATDLPYLSEWSANTNSIIVVPEYDLLPEHHFPVALNQVTDAYTALVDGSAENVLGFRTGRIAVTGESAGGNLAAALTVKLCYDGIVDVEKEQEKMAQEAKVMVKRESSSENFYERLREKTNSRSRERGVVTLPNCLMLSCPALNMCHSMSPSRIMGTGDPVLPSGLIQMISDQYVPQDCGIGKEHPLCSPYFASDEILSCFPSTLLWVSAADPLLDDAVDFNTRLRRVGVNSSIHAAQHMPHAFWGLSNAGFPEAVKVMQNCNKFLFECLVVTSDENGDDKV
ncbi:hypothetical protein TrRE_jg12162 [Triparma retinervis]|uniref:Alpha/beta hydrolase fold-3 domain-containing protein n=1 Tax=Triparma retinervis TaxID=2557542 RepID=A0A9W7AAT5_9STRA|nr:hypothetical protein TrRE_jg12162 [Triparma retinervis]